MRNCLNVLFLILTNQYSSRFYSFFNKKKTSEENKTNLDFISSIWDDDHILRLDEKNCQCLRCTKLFQEIKSTKTLAHVLRKEGMHIKSCSVPKKKAHVTGYNLFEKKCSAVKHVHVTNLDDYWAIRSNFRME